MASCLVTGSTGFIGKKLIDLLCSDGYDVRLLSRSQVENFETVICDLGQEGIPERAVNSVDTIFHLAGVAHDMRDPEKIRHTYHSVNVEATVELAKLAVASGVKHFVFISSVKAGGISSSGECVNEEFKGIPDGLYGETKRKAELELLKIGKESDMRISIVRPALVYGPNVKGNLRLMLSGVKNGWFPPLPEVGNRRSMIHVDDLVRAILLISKNGQVGNSIFIATDGRHYSSREIYNAMRSAIGKSPSKWSIPKALFDLVGLLSPGARYKINKLLGNECYSSAKLEALGFNAEKTLRSINETDL